MQEDTAETMVGLGVRAALADAVAAQSRPSSSAFFVANSSSERIPR